MSVRLELELLTADGLREVAIQQGIDNRGTKSVLLDRLADHFERVGWPERMLITSNEEGNPNNVQGETSSNINTDSAAGPSERNGTTMGNEGVKRNIAFANAIPGDVNIQEIVSAVMQILPAQQGGQANADVISGSSMRAPVTRNMDGGHNMINN